MKGYGRYKAAGKVTLAPNAVGEGVDVSRIKYDDLGVEDGTIVENVSIKTLEGRLIALNNASDQAQARLDEIQIEIQDVNTLITDIENM